MQRTRVLSDIALAEEERKYLEQAQGDPSRLAAEMFSIGVLDESGVQQSSLAQRIAIAVLAALVVAAILTLVRGASGKKPRA